MAAQKGEDILIRIGDSNSPGTFTAIAGLRTATFTINSETVDVTNADTTSKMRQLLAGAGIISFSVQGSGVFTDAATDLSLETEMLAQTHRVYQIVIPDFGTYQGPFQLTQLEYTGEHNGEAQYTIGLESAGDIAFAAA